MFEGDQSLLKVVEYMKRHWPSKVKEEWQVKLEEYPVILEKVLAEMTKDKTKGRKLVRIAGLSGSGKTTQLMPAVMKLFQELKEEPILVAARRFVRYHPHLQEITECYGKENVRKMTDEFSTIMMFMALKSLIREGWDIVLDVTLLDPEMEAILLKMLKAGGYAKMLVITAINPVITNKFLEERGWRHSKATEDEFMRATEESLKFYGKEEPEMRVVSWNVYDREPIYDGAIANFLPIYQAHAAMTKMPMRDEEVRMEEKKKYLGQFTKF